jgi:hypothetical protein
VKPELRNDALGLHHHFAVARLETDEQKKEWLTRTAEAKPKWTVTQLREMLEQQFPSKDKAAESIAYVREMINREIIKKQVASKDHSEEPVPSKNNSGERIEDVVPADHPARQSERWTNTFLTQAQHSYPSYASLPEDFQISEAERAELVAASKKVIQAWNKAIEVVERIPGSEDISIAAEPDEDAEQEKIPERTTH